MTLAAWYVLILVVGALALVAAGKLRGDLAALALAGLLGMAQFAGLSVLDAPGTPSAAGGAAKAISGFGQPVVITLISLFIITRSMEKAGITRLLARELLRIGGRSEARMIGLFAGATAFLSLFMNNLAAVALLLPSALETSRRSGIKPSKLLIPVAFGSLLGGVATYFTTANIIASDLLTIAVPPQARLDVLAFTPTGGLIALAGIAFLAIFGSRLLPDREPPISFSQNRPTGSELEDAYKLGERLWQGVIRDDSPLAGDSLVQAALGERLGVAAVAIWRGQRLIFPLAPFQMLLAGDVVWLVGRADRVRLLAEEGVDLSESREHISVLGLTFVEVILAPRSAALGRSLKDLEFRSRYGFSAIALLRKGRSYRTHVADFKLEMGDSLLMVGEPHNLKRMGSNPSFMVLEPSLSDQPVQRRQALAAGGIMLAAVAASIAGVPVYLSMLIGAVAVILLGLLTMEEAARAVEWQVIFLIAGMYSVSLAMVHTGLAGMIGEAMVRLVTPFGPLGLAAGAYLLSALLTQVMGGQVTALVTGPVTISAAISLGVNPQAIAVAAAIGCSACFIFPLAHPVNVLILSPGGYTFGDFFPIGWRLTLISFVILLAGMALFWGLR
jgi:di/tricarboxylate transporter